MLVRTSLFCYLVLCCLTVVANDNVTLQRISLPKGPGSIEGLGEAFSPSLATGTSVYSLEFQLPPAAAGHVPQLSLVYDSGQQASSFGLGWSLSVDFIQRQTTKGVPRYDDSDTFISGTQELVELDVPKQSRTFLAENQNDYARYRIIGNGWEKTLPNGTKRIYGLTADSREQRPNTGAFRDCFRWHLSSIVDVHGNRVDFHYRFSQAGRSVLERVTYGYQGKREDQAPNFHEIRFQYEQTNFGVIAFTPGFEQRIQERCREVEVATVVAEKRYTVRRYEITYHDKSRHSLLRSITQTDGLKNSLPPTSFTYTESDPSEPQILGRWKLDGELPVGISLRDVALCDLNHDGLTDICFSVPSDGWYHRLNLGHKRFAPISRLDSVKSGDLSQSPMQLRDPRTQLIDITGDGRVDLVSAMPDAGGNYRVVFHELKTERLKDSVPNPIVGDRQSFTNTCSIDLTTRGSRVFDIDFNKCIDIVKLLDDSLLIAQNLKSDYGSHYWKQSIVPYSISQFPSNTVRPTMRLSDVNGDRLMDFLDVLDRDGSVSVTAYYGKGDGGFSSPHSISFTTARGQATVGEHPTSNIGLLDTVDVNADGLTDLVSVIPGNTRIWLSDGFCFGTPIDIKSPEFVSSADIRFCDMDGNGTAELVVIDPFAPTEFQFDVQTLVASGGENLLRTIRNGLGEVTTITYRSACDFQTAAVEKGQSWLTVSPVLPHVVSEVSVTNSLDLDGDGEADSRQVSNYVYSNPYYDGQDKQFCGFSHVTQIDWGDDRDARDGVLDRDSGSATTVTRKKFNNGAPNRDSIYDPIAGFSEEALKGTLIWEEVCGLPAVIVDTNATSAQVRESDETNSELASANLVYRRKVNDWGVRTLYTRQRAPSEYNHKTLDERRVIRDSVLRSEEIHHIEGPNVVSLSPKLQPKHPPKIVRTEYNQNPFGGIVSKRELGVISPKANRDQPRNYVFEYAHKGTAIEHWILDRVCQSTVQTGDGKVVAGKRVRFGDQSNSFDTLKLGEVGKRALEVCAEELLIDDTRLGISGAELDQAKWVQRSWASFSDRGNPVWLLDGMGNRAKPMAGHARKFSFDNVFQSLPVEESVYVDEKTVLSARAAVDFSFGAIIGVIDFNGPHEGILQNSVAGNPLAGAKGPLATPQTKLIYDSHARLTAVVRPGDTELLPTESYSYIPADPEKGFQYPYNANEVLNESKTDKFLVSANENDPALSLAAGLSAVVTEKREDSGETGTLVSIQLSDGQGRIHAKVAEESAERFVVHSEQRFDGRGQASEVLQPRFASSWGLSLDTRRNYVNRDPLGRVIATTYPAAPGKSTSPYSSTLFLPLIRHEYDEEDNRKGGQHKGTFTTYVEDGFGQIVSVVENVRLTIDGEEAKDIQKWESRYTYDLLGNLSQLRDPKKNISTHIYDSLGRRRSVSDPDRETLSFDYNLADKLTKRTDARGAKIEYTYDGANRKLTERGTFAGNVQVLRFHHDYPSKNAPKEIEPRNLLGRLAWIEDAGGEEHFSYNDRGSLEQRTRRFAVAGNPVYTKKEKYDSQDRPHFQGLFKDTQPLLRLTVEFDQRGLVRNLFDDGKSLAAFTYHPNGSECTSTYGNRVVRETLQDERLRLESLRLRGPPDGPHTFPKSLLYNHYVYDEASHLLAIEDHRTSADLPFENPLRNNMRFRLDDSYRLISVTYSSAPAKLNPQADTANAKVEYEYDSIGNRLNSHAEDKNGWLPSNQEFLASLGKVTFDPQKTKAPTKTAGGLSIDYDGAGNANSVNGMMLERDAWGRIVAIQKNDQQVAEYAYSHSGIRIAKFVASANPVLYPFPEIRDEIGGECQTYVIHNNHRIACKTPTSLFFTHRDHLGSLAVTTASDGRKVEEIAYLPNGDRRVYNASEKFTSKFCFGGNERDGESGLHYFQNRYLAPGVAVFLSCDSELPSAQHQYVRYPLGQNPFSYALGNPQHFTDVSGTNPFGGMSDFYFNALYTEGVNTGIGLMNGPTLPSFPSLGSFIDAITFTQTIGSPNPPVAQEIMIEMTATALGLKFFKGSLVRSGGKTLSSRSSRSSTYVGRFPANPNDLTNVLGVEPKLSRTLDGTRRYLWEPNSNTRIRFESHPGSRGKFNPREHGEHYHVLIKSPNFSWSRANNKRRIFYVKPEGHSRGAPTGYLPGERFPGQ